MKRRRYSRIRGFSRVEVIAALLILLVGGLGLAMIQLTAVTARTPHVSSGVRVATGLAQATLDRFRDADWSAVDSSGSGGFQQGPEGVSPAFSRLSKAAGDSVDVRGTIYYRIWHVTPDPEIPALKTVSVWCCWRNGDGPWRQVVLVTQLADAGR